MCLTVKHVARCLSVDSEVQIHKSNVKHFSQKMFWLNSLQSINNLIIPLDRDVHQDKVASNMFSNSNLKRHIKLFEVKICMTIK